jgi:hypothetical protein
VFNATFNYVSLISWRSDLLEKTVDQDSSTNEDFRKVRNDIGFKNLIVQISIAFLITHISYMTNTECIKSEVTTRIQNQQKKYL